MAIFACPSCGRPTKLSVAQPRHFHCIACGQQGTPPEDLSARLEEAGRWLFQMDLRNRQVAVEQRHQLDRLRLFSRIYLVLAVPPTIILAVIAWSAVSGIVEEKDPRWWTLPLFQPPFFGFVALVAFMWLRMRKQRQQFEASRAAIPGAHGQPPECRACGADLPRGPGPYVACEYCKCDNLVDPNVLRRVGRATQETLDAFEARLKRAGSDATATSLKSVASFVVGSVGIPLAWLVVFIVGTLVVALIVGDSRAPKKPIALVTFGKDRCVAELREFEDGKFDIDAGKLPDGKRYLLRRVPRGGFEIATEATIAGKSATWHACATDKYRKTETVTIKRVNDWMGSPRLDLATARGEETWSGGIGCGLCFPAR